MGRQTTRRIVHRTQTRTRKGWAKAKLSNNVTRVHVLQIRKYLNIGLSAPRQQARIAGHAWRARSKLCEWMEMWKLPATLGTGSLHSSWQPSRARKPSCMSFSDSGEVSCSSPPSKKNCGRKVSSLSLSMGSAGARLRCAAKQRQQVVLVGWADVEGDGAPLLVQSHLHRYRRTVRPCNAWQSAKRADLCQTGERARLLRPSKVRRLQRKHGAGNGGERNVEDQRKLRKASSAVYTELHAASAGRPARGSHTAPPFWYGAR